MAGRFFAMHPDPAKQGVGIDADKYYAVRSAIEAVVRDRQPISFPDLVEAVDAFIGSVFEGSVPWYVTTVKLDLEARGILERVPRRRPQHLRLRDASVDSAGS